MVTAMATGMDSMVKTTRRSKNILNSIFIVSDTSANNKRIAKNTLLLYVRTLFIMLITLYTSRVILNTLGVSDYGIYNVVGGVVAMLALLMALCHLPHNVTSLLL